MNIISIHYELIYRLKDFKHIQFTKDLKHVFNYNRQTERKYSLNGSCRGLKVNSKVFIKFKDLNNHIELIPKYEFIQDNFLNQF